jgi:hypothetical protein
MRMTEMLHDEYLERAGIVVHVIPGDRPLWLVVGKTGWVTEAVVRTYQTDRAVQEILRQVQTGRSFSTLNLMLVSWVALSVLVYALSSAFLAVPMLVYGVVEIARYGRDG